MNRIFTECCGTFSRRFLSLCFLSLAAVFTGAAVQVANAADATDAGPVRVLIVTGVEYPGHPWKETAPELRKQLDADERIEARVVEDPEVLGTDLIFDYDVLLIHFKNYDPLKREEAAQRNLERFVEEGGGLMYFHFACGAFQEWPGFERVAGRVWNPEMRGHDPYGRFTVKVVDRKHPIMDGIDDFSVIDELYTCLDGTLPVHLIAEAVSVVDQKTYPIAFVLGCGQGLIFHSVLGHNLESLASPEHVQMLRNAAVWAGDNSPHRAVASATL